MSDKIIRGLNVEARIISEADGTVDYVASDATLDSYREIVDQKGWKFTHFAKNAPFVNSHDYWTIENLLGKVTSFEVRGGQLIERVQWAKDIAESKLAQLGWKLTTGGFLKAVSVGFFPRKMASVWGEPNAWAEACAALKLDTETIAQCRCIHLEQEQIELSACIIGANPNALAKAHKEGCVKDADLAAVGFSDEDMRFLQLAGPAMDDSGTTPLMREMIGREMARIAAGRKHKISGNPGEGTGSEAGKRAAAGEAERLAAQQREFLKQLTALCG